MEEEGEWSRWQRRRGRKRKGVSRGEDSPHWMGMRYHGPGNFAHLCPAGAVTAAPPQSPSCLFPLPQHVHNAYKYPRLHPAVTTTVCCSYIRHT